MNKNKINTEINEAIEWLDEVTGIYSLDAGLRFDIEKLKDVTNDLHRDMSMETLEYIRDKFSEVWKKNSDYISENVQSYLNRFSRNLDNIEKELTENN